MQMYVAGKHHFRMHVASKMVDRSSRSSSAPRKQTGGGVLALLSEVMLHPMVAPTSKFNFLRPQLLHFTILMLDTYGRNWTGWLEDYIQSYCVPLLTRVLHSMVGESCRVALCRHPTWSNSFAYAAQPTFMAAVQALTLFAKGVLADAGVPIEIMHVRDPHVSWL